MTSYPDPRRYGGDRLADPIQLSDRPAILPGQQQLPLHSVGYRESFERDYPLYALPMRLTGFEACASGTCGPCYNCAAFQRYAENRS